MSSRIRIALVAAASSDALLSAVAPSAQASLLSILPGSCGSESASETFAPWGDFNDYTPVAGGTFESGAPGWTLSGEAKVAPGNESYYVSGPGSSSLSPPAGSSALSPASCTSIYHATVRFFVRNTGSPKSVLDVQAMYPTLLGPPRRRSARSPAPRPGSPRLPSSLLSNLLSTVSLNETTVAFRFVPAGSGGAWSIDDVYLDPFCRG